MLEELLDSLRNSKELIEKATEGKLIIDIKNKKITNNKDIENHYYTQEIEKWSRIQRKHPILSGLCYLVYGAFHPFKSNRVCSYLSKLIKENKELSKTF